MLPNSKLCEIEDFQDQEIAQYIKEIFGHEFDPAREDDERVADSKRWEIAMAVRTLEQHGVLHRDADILGVGAGLETTSYYLTKYVGRVFATDIYANAGVWAYGAPIGMLLDPARYYSEEFEENRLLAMHMDARRLRFPDESFDGIYSSGSIEHLGSLDYVANCAFEMGRVIKKGGVLTLATEYKLSGPTDGIGWDPFVILFDPKKLQKYIVDASGLSLIGEHEFAISDATAKVSQPLVEFLGKVDRKASAIIRSEAYPNLVLSHEGYAFGSVHLALYKPMNYINGSNEWAQPQHKLKRIIEREAVNSIDHLSRSAQVEGAANAINADARSKKTGIGLFSATNPCFRTEAGEQTGSLLVVDGTSGGVAIVGPNVDLTPGDYIIEVKLAPNSPRTGLARMEITTAQGSVVHATREVALDRYLFGNVIRTRVVSASEFLDFEVNLAVDEGSKLTIEAIEIRRTTLVDRIRGRIRRSIISKFWGN